MFVCLCNGIRDSELKELGENGVRSPEEAYRSLDAEFACACCREEAEEILCTSADENRPRLQIVSG